MLGTLKRMVSDREAIALERLALLRRTPSR
jgi:hypothetical protein